MCEVNLVKVQCVTVKLFKSYNKKSYIITLKVIIRNHKKMCKSNNFTNYCCSITSRRAELNLVTLQCFTVKVLSILLVTFITFRTLQTVP